MRNCNTVIILFTEEYWDLLQTLNLETQSQSVYLSRSLLLFYSHLIFGKHFNISNISFVKLHYKWNIWNVQINLSTLQ